MTHPTLVRGHDNDAWWVTEAQKLLNATQPTGMTLGYQHLDENGHFDEVMEEDIKFFQTRFGLHVDGKIGPNTWAALLQEYGNTQGDRDAAGAEYERQAKIAEGMAPAPGHHEAEHADPPPTRAEIDRGREVIDHYVDDVVGRATAFAERVSGMGPPSEVLPLIVDGSHTAIELAEIFGVAETSAVLAGAGVLATVAGPFFMWYEAIQANSAGELTAYRWSVYRPWMDGFLAGLYGHGPGHVEELFVPVRDYAYHAAAGLSAEDKRSVLALLVFASGEMGFVDEPDQLTASQWAASSQDRGWTYQGLEKVISGHDS